ncbi:MAG TPA: AsmA-like C-terminal region-containing protein [Candidatus Acidoferrum sp.]
MKSTEMNPGPEKTVRARRWLLPAGVAIILGVLIGGLILARHWPFSANNIVESIQEDWPGKIAVQHFQRTYFPHPGCILYRVVLTRGTATAGPPLVAIQRVTIQANYHDLLFRPGYVSRIILEGLKISVPANEEKGAEADASQKKGKSNNSSVRLGEVITRDAVLEVARKDDQPLRFDIHQLILKSVSAKAAMTYDLAMRNPEPPGEIRSRGKLGPWDSDHLDNIPLNGKYTFTQVDLGVYDGIGGTLGAEGEFNGMLGNIETQGTTEIPNFQVTHAAHPVLLKTKFRALVDGTGGDTALRSVDGTFRHTAVHVEGTVASKAGLPGKTTTLSFAVHGGHIEDVLWLFVKENKPPMLGTTNFHGRMVWPSTEHPFLKRITLQGEFEIDHAQWENAERRASLNDLSKRASGKKKDAPAEDVTANMKGSVTMTNAVAKLKDVSVAVPGAEATMNGTYGLENKKIDFHGNLKTDASLSKESNGAKAILLKPLDPFFKRKNAGAVVPVEMSGTYDDPHFGFSITGSK